ncbi:NAAT family transporter, partial [Escherichia coli]
MIQTFFDFPVYFKFFIGLFALVNPVGIIPVFISMTSYQTAAARNKTNLTANLSVAIILWISLFLGDTILQLFGISIDSFRIAGGILVVTIAMSMISGKLGEDKQNKQEKSETAVRERFATHGGYLLQGKELKAVQDVILKNGALNAAIVG